MSHEVTKTAIRLPISDWNGLSWHGVYKKIREILGDADDVDEFEGVVEHFTYKDYQVVRCKHGGVTRYAVDSLLEPIKASCEHDGLNLTLAELSTHCSALASKFGGRVSDCLVIATTWYNGVDEPVAF